MENINNYIDEIMELIGKNKIQEAVKELSSLLKGSKELDKIVLTSARYVDIMEQIRSGSVAFEDASIEKNKIRFALISIVNDLYDNQEIVPKLKSDVTAYLEERKSNISEVKGDNNIIVQDTNNSNISINITKN